MQTKKDEIRKTILEAAQKEFSFMVARGLCSTIAKKANTTLGNIYHYYENKEAILEELMREPVEKVKKMIDDHMKLQDELFTMSEMQGFLDDLDHLMDYHEMQCLMDERLVILFDPMTNTSGMMPYINLNSIWHGIWGWMTMIPLMWISL